MNLTELYAQTPAERHGDIKIAGDRVLVRDAEGYTSEYLLSAESELWLIGSDRALRQDLAAIKDKLGI